MLTLGYLLYTELPSFLSFRLGLSAGTALLDSVHLYADRSAYDSPPGTRVVMGTADMDSEPAVNQQCQDPGGKAQLCGHGGGLLE